jgi:hypothetical protein
MNKNNLHDWAGNRTRAFRMKHLHHTTVLRPTQNPGGLQIITCQNWIILTRILIVEWVRISQPIFWGILKMWIHFWNHQIRRIRNDQSWKHANVWLRKIIWRFFNRTQTIIRILWKRKKINPYYLSVTDIILSDKLRNAQNIRHGYLIFTPFRIHCSEVRNTCLWQNLNVNFNKKCDILSPTQI